MLHQKKRNKGKDGEFAQGAMFGRALQNAVGGCSWVLQNRRETRTTMGGSSLSIAGHVAGKVGQEAEGGGCKIEAL